MNDWMNVCIVNNSNGEIKHQNNTAALTGLNGGK